MVLDGELVTQALDSGRPLYLIDNVAKRLSFEAFFGALPDSKPSASHWNEPLRLAKLLKRSPVTAPANLRKGAATPRQKQLASVLREIAPLDRAVFTLEDLRDLEFRSSVHEGHAKGEGRNAVAGAVSLKRLGDRRGCHLGAASTGWLASVFEESQQSVFQNTRNCARLAGLANGLFDEREVRPVMR